MKMLSQPPHLSKDNSSEDREHKLEIQFNILTPCGYYSLLKVYFKSPKFS